MLPQMPAGECNNKEPRPKVRFDRGRQTGCLGALSGIPAAIGETSIARPLSAKRPYTNRKEPPSWTSRTRRKRY